MSWQGGAIFLALFIASTCPQTRSQCEEAKSTLQINECFSAELKKATTELNRVYRSTLKKLEPTDAVLLRKAQATWAAYRDAQCEAEYALWGGGTGGPAAMMSCKLELTQERTKEIQNTYLNR